VLDRPDDVATTVRSIDGSKDETFEPIPQAKLDKIARGSTVKVLDPEADVWYWVIIEKRLKEDLRCFKGRINGVGLGPSLRHGGKVFFHEDNVLSIWPAKADPMFDKTWFRVMSHLLSMNTGCKALKRPANR
jgi:hypothetical protein